MCGGGKYGLIWIDRLFFFIGYIVTKERGVRNTDLIKDILLFFLLPAKPRVISLEFNPIRILTLLRPATSRSAVTMPHNPHTKRTILNITVAATEAE